jgi:integrase
MTWFGRTTVRVVARTDGRPGWRLFVRTAGRPRWSKTFTKRADADRMQQLLLHRLGEGSDVHGQLEAAQRKQAARARLPVVSVGVEGLIAKLVAMREWRGTTPDGYRSVLAKHVWPFQLEDGRTLGTLRVDELKREHLGAVIRAIRAQQLSRGVLERLRAPIRRYYDELRETGLYTGENPAADLRYFVGKLGTWKSRPTKALAHFTLEEASDLLLAALETRPRWAAFIATGFLAGLRWGECAALHVSDLDLRLRTGYISRGVTRARGRGVWGTIQATKTNRARTVHLSPELVAILRRHCEAFGISSGLIFPTTRGNPISYADFMRRVWHPLLRLAGLPLAGPDGRARGFHATRHSYATWRLERPAEGSAMQALLSIQQELGHASIRTTVDTYGHVAESGPVAAVDALGALLWPQGVPAYGPIRGWTRGHGRGKTGHKGRDSAEPDANKSITSEAYDPVPPERPQANKSQA